MTGSFEGEDLANVALYDALTALRGQQSLLRVLVAVQGQPEWQQEYEEWAKLFMLAEEAMDGVGAEVALRPKLDQPAPGQQTQQPEGGAAQGSEGEAARGGTGGGDQSVDQNDGGLQQVGTDQAGEPGHLGQQREEEDAEEADEEDKVSKPTPYRWPGCRPVSRLPIGAVRGVQRHSWVVVRRHRYMRTVYLEMSGRALIWAGIMGAKCDLPPRKTATRRLERIIFTKFVNLCLFLHFGILCADGCWRDLAKIAMPSWGDAV